MSRSAIRHCLVTLICLSPVGTLADLPPRSDHRSITVVPALEPVKIDGVLSEGEWDRSGRIHVYGSRNVRHHYSVDFHSMWDRKYLYAGLHFKDKTPMVNNVDGRGAPFDGWQSDAVQFRFVTSGSGVGKDVDGYKAIHMDAWYSSLSDYCTMALSYDRSLAKNAVVVGGAGQSLDDTKTGLATAFQKDPDGKGYVQEVRIPWTLLYKTVPNLKPRLSFRWTGEFYWGAPNANKWSQFFHQDPMSRPDRTNTYKSPQNWGLATLGAQNHLDTDEPSVLEFTGEVQRVVVHGGLKVYHEGSFMNPGNPGWNTADGSGGWLGDHRVPKWSSTMPPEVETERGLVFLSSEGGESVSVPG